MPMPPFPFHLRKTLSGDVVARLAYYFRRNGYVRWQNPRRLKREGHMGYKKGDELRFSAQSRKELLHIRNLLRKADFSPGRAFRKGTQWRQPIYGRDEVIRFLRLVRERFGE